ncbi:MAG: SpoIIE family protein phosphatase, partial [Bryobacteraceae bacterium]
VAYLQGRLNYDQISMNLEPGTAAGLPFVQDDGGRLGRLSPAAKAAGLQENDRLMTIDGHPMPGSASIQEMIAAHRTGDMVAIHVERAGAPVNVTFPLPPFGTATLSWTNWAFLLIVNLLTPWLCLLLGFFVAFLRPRDLLAWLLLGLLLGFSQMTNGDAIYAYANRWDPVSRSASWFYSQGMAAWWPLFMMLFGVYFPDRAEPKPWQRWAMWIFGLPLAIFGLVNGFANAWQAAEFQASAGLVAYLQPISRYFWIFSFPATGTFFANIAAKASMATNPDTRRRLRILYFGSTISLTPIFLVVLATIPWGRNFTSLPAFIWIPALLLLFLFPATLAYVIVVQRAMDVRMVVRQGLQYALATRAILMIRGIAIAAVFIWLMLSLNDPAARRPQRLQWVAYAVAFVVLSGRLSERVKIWVDKRFFREALDTERVLGDLGDQVRTIVETKPLLEKVSGTIAKAMHVSHVAALLSKNGFLEPAYAFGYGDVPAVSFASAGPTVASLKKTGEPLRYYADDKQSWAHTEPGMEAERPKLDALRSQLLLPLQAGGQMLGVLSLGAKRSEEPYSNTEVKLLQTVALQTSLALENARLTTAVATEVAQRERLNRELEIAREVQERLFPQTGPAIEGLDYAGKCRPAASIGGDYYDFFLTDAPASAQHDGRELGIAIGDISGKGIPAALLMASLQASLRGLTIGVPSLLAALMENLNKLIYETSPSNRYATFFYSQYDPATRRLAYVNGGHNPPIVLRANGEVERLEVGGPVVGLFGPAKYEQGEVTLARGDTVVMFTDGVSEAMNEADDEFGEDRLIETVLAHKDLSPKDVIEKILIACDVFADGAPQHDDMTAVVVRVV